jgi:hypothetical protein
MFSVRENIPLIIGVIAIGVVVWLIWRDIGSLKKTVTTVVNEHNETASILDQHKHAINNLSSHMAQSEYEGDDEFDENEESDPEIEPEVKQKVPNVVELTEKPSKSKKHA